MIDSIKEAMERFEVPSGHENLLFCLPAFYVAKADGKISMKEAFSIVWNSVTTGLIKPRGDEKKAFDGFVQRKLLHFQSKTSLDDFGILADAINAKLAQYPADAAQSIRDTIHDTCTKVAKSSGPLFREKVSPEERQMLDKIFAVV